MYIEDPQASPPSDWQLVRGWLTRVYKSHRTPFLIAAQITIALVAILAYNALRPVPQRLTQRDIDAAVDRSLDNAPPKPSNASVAYDVILPSVVAVEAVVPQVMARQPENDLAVLSATTVPDDLKPATLVSSASLHVGDEVIAVGNPFGVFFSTSDGVVSGLGRQYTSRETGATLKNLIQFDAAVNPGNSGGPLVNRNGEVVGIVTSLLNPTNQDVFIGIGFAVPIDTAGGVMGSSPM
ncbi:MAG: trypsin-like peptidase domain-containing protein [Spirochaetia bacterium]